MSDKVHVTFTINGEPAAVDVDPRELLIHTLRERLRLTGAHIGCETSHCGACTVDYNGASVKSCTLLTVQCQGAGIVTVEGLASAEGLHPLQAAFSEEHGLQCGYCTPGMLMRSWRLLQDEPSPDEAAIRFAMSGNLCRCTGYQNIVRAVDRAARELREESAQASAAGE